jgi:hypothetical protein
MNFGDKNLNELLGDILSSIGGKQDLFIGQQVTANLNAFTEIKGKLVSKSTNLNPFCIVDGWITKNGIEIRDSRILVPLNLLKAK